MSEPSRADAVFLWRKLDGPGHDSCRLFELPRGWRLCGDAVFSHGRKPCHLHYEVSTDSAWRSRNAAVTGHIGVERVDVRVRSAGPGRWRIDGVEVKGVTGCIDLDLAFTPATNLIALRRLALKVGESADAPGAWLRFPEMRLVELPQSYRRVSRREYEYEAPTVGYRETLQVLPSGAVSVYPGLFERVTSI